MKTFPFLTLCIAMVAGTLSPTKSQAQVFEEGSHGIYAGYGFVTFLGALNSTFDDYSNVNITSLGPVYFKYEYGLSDNIGLGLNIAYATNKWAYDVGDANQYTASMNRSTYSVLARLNYHMGSSDKFDPYVGIGLGYRDATWSFETTDPDGGGEASINSLMPLGLELTVGARYMFVENFGLYAEIGAAKSIVQLGVSAKF